MGASGRYALYHFKHTLVRLAVIIIYAIVTVNYFFHQEYGYDFHEFSHFIFAINFTVLAFIVVNFEFSPFKNRRNLDSWFSFPISRTRLILTHALNGAAQLFIVHTISYIWALIIIIPYIEKCGIQISVLGTSYIVFLIVGLLLYGFLMFPLLLANNVVDSVILEIFYLTIPFPVMMLFDELARTHLLTFEDELWYGLLANIFELASHFDIFLTRGHDIENNYYASLRFTGGDIAVIVIWCVIGAALAALSVWMFSRLKTEKIGGTSDHICAYRLCIPVLMISIVLLAGGSVGIGSLYGICTYILYVIFRRSAKIKIPDIIVTAVVLVLGNLPIYYVGEISRMLGNR